MRGSFPQAFWSVVVIGITAVVLALIGISGVQSMRAKTFSITVTGSAVKSIRSDLAVWTFEVRYSGYDEYKSLYNKLRAAPQAVSAFLTKQSIPSSAVQVGAVFITKTVESKEVDCRETDPDCRTVVKDKIKLRYKTISRVRYTVSRSFKVESTQVDDVIKSSNAYDVLLDQDILVEESSLQLIYTKLVELRLELVKRASEDAYTRADLIAKPAGRRITIIEDGRLGVFQITPKNDPSVEDLGNFDTTSLEKDVRAIVTATYRVE